MNFVMLTDKDTKNPIMVNLSRIVMFSPCEDNNGCYVDLNHDASLEVNEGFNDIVASIELATRERMMNN